MERTRASQPKLKPHRPDILYFGCVDARLRTKDLGFKDGQTIIKRDIAALITPGNVATGATLEFFADKIPYNPGKKKHIIVAGHTDCGGIKTCCGGACEHGSYLQQYLEGLKDAHSIVMEKAATEGWDHARILREVEKESVRQSVANLETYPSVQRALADHTLEIHGWLLDTASKQKLVMDHATGEFEPMTPEYARALDLDVRAAVRPDSPRSV